MVRRLRRRNESEKEPAGSQHVLVRDRCVLIDLMRTIGRDSVAMPAEVPDHQRAQLDIVVDRQG